MTKTTALLSLILLSTAAGCARTTDLGKMQEETIGVVKMYDQELVVLERWAQDLDKKARLLGPLVTKDAGQKLQNAAAAITAGRNTVASAPTLASTAAKSGKAEELHKLHDETVEKLAHDIDVARANLDAFDTHISAVESGPVRAPAAPAADPHAPVANDDAHGDAPVDPAANPANPSNIPCTAEIFLKCPGGQVDACSKGAANHGCVPE